MKYISDANIQAIHRYFIFANNHAIIRKPIKTEITAQCYV